MPSSLLARLSAGRAEKLSKACASMPKGTGDKDVVRERTASKLLVGERGSASAPEAVAGSIASALTNSQLRKSSFCSTGFHKLNRTQSRGYSQIAVSDKIS